MPIHVYACGRCRRDFEEVVIGVHSPVPPELPCPSCGHLAAKGFGVPRIRTAATFIANAAHGGAQFGAGTREHYLALAREAGVSTDGKAYDGRLARFPGDPEAWIESQDDVRRVCERRGWGCDGDVKVKAPEAPPVERPLVADDIVEDLVEQRLAEKYGDDLDGVSVPVAEYERVRGDVIEKHAPPAHLQGDLSRG